MLHSIAQSEPMVAPVNQRNTSDQQRQCFSSLVDASAMPLGANEMELCKDNDIAPEGIAPGGASIAALDHCLIRSLMVPPGRRRRLRCGAAGPLNQILPLLILATVAGAWAEPQPTTPNPILAWERMVGFAIFIICFARVGKGHCNSGKSSGGVWSNLTRGFNKGVSRSPSNSKNKKGKQKRTKKPSESPSSDESDGGDDPDDDAESHQSEQLMACPFFSLDPIRYHDCGGYVLKSFYRVTQHMRRFHALGQLACPTCFHSFPNHDERDAHQIRRTCSPPLGRDRLNVEELGKLTRVRGENDEAKWFSIWDALFQPHPRPNSPYIKEGVARYGETLGRLAQQRYYNICYNRGFDQIGLGDNYLMPSEPSNFLRDFIYPLIRPPYNDMEPIFRIPITIPSVVSQDAQAPRIWVGDFLGLSSGPGSTYSFTDPSRTTSQPPYDDALSLLGSGMELQGGNPSHNNDTFPETEVDDENAQQLEPGYVQRAELVDGNLYQYPGYGFSDGQADARRSQGGGFHPGNNGSYF